MEVVCKDSDSIEVNLTNEEILEFIRIRESGNEDELHNFIRSITIEIVKEQERFESKKILGNKRKISKRKVTNYEKQ